MSIFGDSNVGDPCNAHNNCDEFVVPYEQVYYMSCAMMVPF